jgi:hypothetical protein
MFLPHIPGDGSHENLMKIKIFSQLLLYDFVGGMSGFIQDSIICTLHKILGVRTRIHVSYSISMGQNMHQRSLFREVNIHIVSLSFSRFSESL